MTEHIPCATVQQSEWKRGMNPGLFVMRSLCLLHSSPGRFLLTVMISTWCDYGSLDILVKGLYSGAGGLWTSSSWFITTRKLPKAVRMELSKTVTRVMKSPDEHMFFERGEKLAT